MLKHILALLVILAFFDSQVFIQGQTCTTPQEEPPPGIATVFIFNNRFEPDCLTVRSGQTILWGTYYCIRFLTNKHI
jgi:hypothetical protein